MVEENFLRKIFNLGNFVLILFCGNGVFWCFDFIDIFRFRFEVMSGLLEIGSLLLEVESLDLDEVSFLKCCFID